MYVERLTDGRQAGYYARRIASHYALYGALRVAVDTGDEAAVLGLCMGNDLGDLDVGRLPQRANVAMLRLLQTCGTRVALTDVLFMFGRPETAHYALYVVPAVRDEDASTLARHISRHMNRIVVCLGGMPQHDVYSVVPALLLLQRERRLRAARVLAVASVLSAEMSAARVVLHSCLQSSVDARLFVATEVVRHVGATALISAVLRALSDMAPDPLSWTAAVSAVRAIDALLRPPDCSNSAPQTTTAAVSLLERGRTTDAAALCAIVQTVDRDAVHATARVDPRTTEGAFLLADRLYPRETGNPQSDPALQPEATNNPGPHME